MSKTYQDPTHKYVYPLPPGDRNPNYIPKEKPISTLHIKSPLKPRTVYRTKTASVYSTPTREPVEIPTHFLGEGTAPKKRAGPVAETAYALGMGHPSEDTIFVKSDGKKKKKKRSKSMGAANREATNRETYYKARQSFNKVGSSVKTMPEVKPMPRMPSRRIDG